MLNQQLYDEPSKGHQEIIHGYLRLGGTLNALQIPDPVVLHSFQVVAADLLKLTRAVPLHLLHEFPRVISQLFVAR